MVLQDPAIAAAGAADADDDDDHDDERLPFACTYPSCTERFAQADVCKNHMAVHSDEKPFKCEHDGCTCSFKFKSSLWKHKKIHKKLKKKFPKKLTSDPPPTSSSVCPLTLQRTVYERLDEE